MQSEFPCGDGSRRGAIKLGPFPSHFSLLLILLSTYYFARQEKPLALEAQPLGKLWVTFNSRGVRGGGVAAKRDVTAEKDLWWVSSFFCAN